MIERKYKGAIFDLDGVIVDTAKYHYLAWRELANELGFDFSEEENEALKGVSRTASLDILLRIGEITATKEEKQEMADSKNKRYVKLLSILTSDELLPGSLECLQTLRKMGVKIALGSASKNAPTILKKLNITELFDSIIDGNKVTKAKPDPEVFIIGAEELGLKNEDCVIFEDAQAGIDAIIAMGAYPVAVGSKENLKGGKLYINNLGEFPISEYF